MNETFYTLNVMRFKLSTFILWSVISIILIISYSTFLYYLLDSWDKRASFGSMFGAISTLFAGLSFAGVIYTINVQREEIRSNQKIYGEKIKEQNRLNFENKFFILYNDLLSSTNRLLIEYNTKQYINHQFFKGAYYKILNSPNIDWKKAEDPDAYKRTLNYVYNIFMHEVQNEYSVYTSKLYFILKYIDKETTINLNDKLFYSELINCELNSYAMILLRYHAIYKEEHKDRNWKILLKKYNLLNRINTGYFLNQDFDNKIWEND